jgi:hypothetical protein
MMTLYNDGILAGFTAGFTTTFLCYPFDIYKTFQQDLYYRKNAPKTFFEYYRGVKYPLLQSSISGAIIFHQYEYLKKKYPKQQIYSNLLIAMCESLIICPIDKFKITSQQMLHYPLNFKNILHSYKDIGIVAARKIPATTIYLTTYQYLKTYDIPIFVAGGIAGMLNWGITYPIDTIKTRIQNESCYSINEAVKKGKLWNGVKVAMIRAFFVCGINFFTYEKILSLLK